MNVRVINVSHVLEEATWGTDTVIIGVYVSVCVWETFCVVRVFFCQRTAPSASLRAAVAGRIIWHLLNLPPATSRPRQSFSESGPVSSKWCMIAVTGHNLGQNVIHLCGRETGPGVCSCGCLIWQELLAPLSLRFFFWGGKRLSEKNLDLKKEKKKRREEEMEAQRPCLHWLEISVHKLFWWYWSRASETLLLTRGVGRYRGFLCSPTAASHPRRSVFFLIG